MKKVFSLLLLLMLVFSISACKNSDNESKPADTSAATQTSAEIAGKSEKTVLLEQTEESEEITSLEQLEESKETISLELTAESERVEVVETVQDETEGNKEVKLNVQVGGTTFYAALEKNSAVDAFVEMMNQAPVVINMSDYSGFEKVGSLGQSLPSSNSQTTTQSGDIVLYNGNQIVIFYGSNSWSYTRIGKIDDLSGWAEALGTGDVTVTFSIGE